jgi:hypothetical protein
VRTRKEGKEVYYALADEQWTREVLALSQEHISKVLNAVLACEVVRLRPTDGNGSAVEARKSTS